MNFMKYTEKTSQKEYLIIISEGIEKAAKAPGANNILNSNQQLRTNNSKVSKLFQSTEASNICYKEHNSDIKN